MRDAPAEGRAMLKMKGKLSDENEDTASSDKGRSPPIIAKCKMEVPTFRGEDVEGWTRGMERYFKIHLVRDEDKVDVVMPHLVGQALQWFVWTIGRYILDD